MNTTVAELTFDFPDFAEKVPEDVREQVLMTHLLPCVKVWCHVAGSSSYKCFVSKFSVHVGTGKSNMNIC